MRLFGFNDPAMMIGQLIGSAPSFLVLLIATLMAVGNLRNRPREGWTVLVLVSLAGFSSFGLSVITNFVAAQTGLDRVGNDGQPVWQLWVLYLLPHSTINAIHWGLVLWLVFGRPAFPAGRYLEEDPAP